MTGPFTEKRVRLQRDALTTPWGFRLQGGKDFKTPLTVQRVFVGSPADGELHRGDIILGIDNNDAYNLTHKAAQDIIKHAGGSIALVVKSSTPPRAGPPSGPQPSALSHHNAPHQQQGYRSRGLDTIDPKPAPPIGAMFGGTDYSRGPGGGYHQVRPPTGPGPRQDNMLNKVNQSLSHALWTPGAPGMEEDSDYQPKPIHDIKQLFSQPTHQQHHAAHSHGRPASHSPGHSTWRKPEVTTSQRSLVEPGWAPKAKGQSAAPPMNTFNSPNPVQPQHRQAPHYQAPHYPAAQHSAPDHHHHQPGAHRPISHEEPGPPAWQGTLRGSGGSKAWDTAAAQQIAGPQAVQQHSPAHHAPAPQPHQPRVQNMHYGPEGQRYEQNAAGAGDTASVKHLQYNTPIGLYSKKNAQEVLTGQTSGRPGEGTIGISGGGPAKEYNPEQSDVFRLIQEEEGRPRGHGLRPSGGSAPATSAHSPAQQYSPAPHGGTYQGPSMQALEYTYGGEGGADHSMATSDF